MIISYKTLALQYAIDHEAWPIQYLPNSNLLISALLLLSRWMELKSFNK